MELSDLEKKILIHIYKYGPDTPWLMARRLLGEHGWAGPYLLAPLSFPLPAPLISL